MAAHGIKFGERSRFLGEPERLRCGLVDDIEAVLAAASRQGAFVAHPPREIPGKGTFAIYIQGDVNHGLWQL
jgi:predicted enzyme related to lactoylglutathione lyase